MGKSAFSIASVAAGVFLALPAAAWAESSDICAALRADMAASSGMASPSAIEHEISRAKNALGQIAVELDRAGCGGSVMIIRGSEGNACTALEAEAADIQVELFSLISERDAMDRSVIYSDPDVIRAELRANGCAAGDETQEQASYSQFRRPQGNSAIIEVAPQTASIDSNLLSTRRPTAIRPEEEEEYSLLPPPTEAEIAADEAELIDLQTRMEQRDVRVVGPTFLPDQSEAIDLKSRVPTFFQ